MGRHVILRDTFATWLAGAERRTGRQGAPLPYRGPGYGASYSPERRRPSMAGRLLVRVGETEERRLAPRASEELQASRQRPAAGKAHRHGDRREAGAW